MASGSIVRCMGPVGAPDWQIKKCNLCKRLPRNRDDEDAPKWIKATADCEHFCVADREYLLRHPIGKGPY